MALIMKVQEPPLSKKAVLFKSHKSALLNTRWTQSAEVITMMYLPMTRVQSLEQWPQLLKIHLYPRHKAFLLSSQWSIKPENLTGHQMQTCKYKWLVPLLPLLTLPIVNQEVCKEGRRQIQSKTWQIKEYILVEHLDKAWFRQRHRKTLLLKVKEIPSSMLLQQTW